MSDWSFRAFIGCTFAIESFLLFWNLKLRKNNANLRNRLRAIGEIISSKIPGENTKGLVEWTKKIITELDRVEKHNEELIQENKKLRENNE